MSYLFDLFASGLAIGAVYGLVAMAFAIIYKSTGLLNFAQGEIAMIIAYVAWTISGHVDGNPLIVAAGAILFAVAFGLGRQTGRSSDWPPSASKELLLAFVCVELCGAMCCRWPPADFVVLCRERQTKSVFCRPQAIFCRPQAIGM